MSQVILHKNDNGGVSITVPAPGYDINKAAKAAVPNGQNYQIVDKAVVDEMYATHGDYREAWEYDETQPASGQGTSATTYSEVE